MVRRQSMLLSLLWLVSSSCRPIKSNAPWRGVGLQEIGYSPDSPSPQLLPHLLISHMDNESPFPCIVIVIVGAAPCFDGHLILMSIAPRPQDVFRREVILNISEIWSIVQRTILYDILPIFLLCLVTVFPRIFYVCCVAILCLNSTKRRVATGAVHGIVPAWLGGILATARLAAPVAIIRVASVLFMIFCDASALVSSPAALSF